MEMWNGRGDKKCKSIGNLGIKGKVHDEEIHFRIR